MTSNKSVINISFAWCKPLHSHSLWSDSETFCCLRLCSVPSGPDEDSCHCLWGLMTGFPTCSPSEHQHSTSEKEKSPIPLRSVIWLPVLLKNITCSWGQINQTYVNIYLVGVWNCAHVNAQSMLALQGGGLPSDTVTQSALCIHKIYFSHLKSLEDFVDEKDVFKFQKWSRVWVILLLPNGGQAEDFNFLMFQNSSISLKFQVWVTLFLFVVLESPKEILPSFLYFS